MAEAGGELIDILVTRAFLPELVASAAGSWSVRQGPVGFPIPRSDLLELAGSVRALCSGGHDRIDAELLDSAPRLQVVANFGVGYDSVDVPEATARGIWVTNTPDVLTESTADIALLLILATLRRAGEAFEHVRHGRWTTTDPDAFWGVDPGGRALGILGMGRIGQAIARRGAALGMRIIYHRRTALSAAEELALGATRMPFEELLAEADVLTIHLPLDASTRRLVGAPELARMRPGSFLINTARGGIVDEAALAQALASGHLGGVGLDVFDDEPFVPAALRDHPHAFLLPHIGSATGRTRGAMMRLCMANAVAVLGGQRPLTPVNEPSPDLVARRAPSGDGVAQPKVDR